MVAELPPLQDVVQRAWSQRLDLKAAAAQLQSAEEARSGTRRRRKAAVRFIERDLRHTGCQSESGCPSVSGSGLSQSALCQGGRIEADTAQADAVVKQRRAELADQRSSVESDVRTAYIDLQVANDQVKLADSNRKLATQTLQQSQDRFAVGVADSVEVVSSSSLLLLRTTITSTACSLSMSPKSRLPTLWEKPKRTCPSYSRGRRHDH